MDLLCRTVRILTDKRLRALRVVNGGRGAADRTAVRNRNRAGAGQVLRDLGYDHVRLVHADLVADSQFQPLQDADIVHAGPCHRGSFQFHRLEHGNRIDQAGSGRTPLNFKKMGECFLVLPLERDRVSRGLRCVSQRITIRDIIIQRDKAVGRDLKMPDLLLKPRKHLIQAVRVRDPVFHHLKALPLQEGKLFLP